MKNESDELSEPYLPPRYKEAVRKKKQRRLLKKVAMVAIAAIAVVAVYIAVSGFFGAAPAPSPKSPSLPAPDQKPAVPAPEPSVEETPALVVTIPRTTVPGTETIIPATTTPEPVLTARAGTYMTPDSDTGPSITRKQAEAIALAAFSDLPAGDMTVELADSEDFGQVWEYTLRADTTVEASGLLDAGSGIILTFNRTVHSGGRPYNPVLTMSEARQIADSTINSRNSGILSINMSDWRYNQLVTPGGNLAGSYRFNYNRIIQDYPCDADGFIVSVDAVSGEITEYVQHWQTPDNAFMIAEEAVVLKYDATYTVLARAKTIYPSSVAGLRIISADIRWKDRHDPATIPRPGTIPLAWKVVFDDDIIRARDNPVPSVGWVDAQSGELLEITYRH